MMKAIDFLPLSAVRLLAFLREELAEQRPGRLPQTLQLWASCLIVVLASMTFEVPFLALSLVVLFYGVQSNAFYTRLVAVLFIIATVLEIGSMLLIYKWSYSYPLIRLIIASLIVLASMFMMRAHRMGLVFFSVAIIAIYGQTFPSMLDYPEIALRLTLWCIVVGLYPTLLMTLIGVLWFPSRAGSQLRQALRRQLAEIDERLAGRPAADLADERRMAKEAQALQKLHLFCLADDAGYRAASPWWQNCIATVGGLRMALSRDTPAMPADAAAQALLQRMRAEVASLDAALAADQPWRSRWTPDADQLATARACGLGHFCAILRQLAEMDPATPPTPMAKPSAMLPDAFSNPAYLRYALKTLLACLICYVFYSGADWEGIHTCMLTCIIVANPSLGSSYQKMALRFGGAFCGAVCALIFTIFIMPWLDNIVELLTVLAPLFLLSAWIATGSERSAYIGTQLVVTFSLATLENVFGPVVNLVEIRDRAIGIIIGTAVSALIHTFIWPESEAGVLPRKLAEALEQIARLLRIPRRSEAATLRGYLQLRVSCLAALLACDELCDRVALEQQLDADERRALVDNGRAVLRCSRRMLRAWDDGWSRAEAADNDAGPQRLAQALERYAAGLTSGAPVAIDADAAARPLTPTEQCVMQQIACLPNWRAPAPASAREQTRGDS